MWQKRSEWLPTREEDPFYIDEFWHGSKMQEYKKFWDPDSTWQQLLICPNDQCRKVYRLWPSTCEELEKDENFDMERGGYHFPCVDCATEIDQKVKDVKVISKSITVAHAKAEAYKNKC